MSKSSTLVPKLLLSAFLIAGAAEAAGKKGVDCFDLEAAAAKAIAAQKAKQPFFSAVAEFAIVDGKKNVTEEWLARHGEAVVDSIKATPDFLLREKSFSQKDCELVHAFKDPNDKQSHEADFKIIRFTKTDFEMEPDWKKIFETAFDDMERDMKKAQEEKKNGKVAPKPVAPKKAVPPAQSLEEALKQVLEEAVAEGLAKALDELFEDPNVVVGAFRKDIDKFVKEAQGSVLITVSEEKDGLGFLTKQRHGSSDKEDKESLGTATVETKQRFVWGANAQAVKESPDLGDFRKAVTAAVKKFPPKK